MTDDSSSSSGSFESSEKESGSALAYGVWFCLIFASFWTSGIVFGWPALVLMFNKKQIFSELCAGSEDCQERQRRLNLVFSGGFFCMLAGRLAWGLFLDWQGPKKTAMVAALTICVGAILMAFSFGDMWRDAVAPGYVLMSLGGPGVHLANFHAGNLFPKIKRTVTASFSGVYGTSGLVFVIINAAYQAGLNGFHAWGIFAGILCCIVVVYALIQPSASFKPGDQLACKRYCIVATRSSGNSNAASQAPHNSRWEALLDWRMLGLGLFFGAGFLNLQFYLGQAEAMLNHLGDLENHENAYLIAFNTIGSSALAIFYPIGRAMDKTSWHAVFFSSLALSLIYNLVSLVDSLELQVLGFICWCISRLLLFAGFFSFIPATVGFARFGFVAGALSVLAAVIGLLNVPLANLATHYGMKAVMLGFLGLHVPMASFPCLLWRSELRGSQKMSGP